MSVTDEPTFNDDLLANDEDRRTVGDLYPALAHVLYHDDLIAYFKQFNERADAAKSKSRAWGKWAIVLGATALVLAAAEIIAEGLSPNHLPLAIGVVAALSGLASVSIGAFSVLLGSRKRAWLHNRFMGERIRQFHFQFMIAHIPQILLSIGKGDETKEARERLESARRRSFHAFQDEFGRNLDSKFTSAIGPYGEQDFWLLGAQDDRAALTRTPELDLVLDAYRHLRIKHQLGFVNYKLQSDHRIFSAMPLRQAEVLENVSKVGIAWLFLIHICVLLVVLFYAVVSLTGIQISIPADRTASIVSYIFSAAIIVVAIVALSARAFQQGLQPEREVERYQQYRSSLQSILDEFDDAQTPRQKIRVMRQMERLAFDEMRNFLLTHERSTFAM